MCTVSWKFSEAGYDLFFNRDEKNERLVATEPELKERNDVQYIAPTDPNGGGTWLATNEYGNTIFLLNRYPAMAPTNGRSRGLLVSELVDVANRHEFGERIRSESLVKFAAFTAGLITATQEISIFSWDGKDLREILPSQTFLTSSSFDTENVEKERSAFFRSTQPNTLREFHSFHRSHLPGRGAFSICMHRDDAQTVSYSHIRVRSRFSQFRYIEGSPCFSSRLKTTGLALRKVPDSACALVR